MEDVDSIVFYLEDIFFEFLLYSEVIDVGWDLYFKFVLFMWNSKFENDVRFCSVLSKEFGWFNDFLRGCLGVYFDGNMLKLLDCNLLLKLMYVKEVGELKVFIIFEEYEVVLIYVKEVIKERVFKDIFIDVVKNDIKEGWKKKMGNLMGINLCR